MNERAGNTRAGNSEQNEESRARLLPDSPAASCSTMDWTEDTGYSLFGH